MTKLEMFQKTLDQAIETEKNNTENADLAHCSNIENGQEYYEFEEFCNDLGYYPEFAFQGLLGSNDNFFYLSLTGNEVQS